MVRNHGACRVGQWVGPVAPSQHRLLQDGTNAIRSYSSFSKKSGDDRWSRVERNGTLNRARRSLCEGLGAESKHAFSLMVPPSECISGLRQFTIISLPI